ncbi:MAG: NADPH-dependent F420 reductase [Myxococcota bacterium]|jgi:NADPH-dependent F420 reductase
MTKQNDAIAILGGTGDQGLGLALRFAKAGRTVIIGSRKAERAVTAAQEVIAAVPGATVSGCGNEEATEQAGIIIISVPFEHTAGTVKGIKGSLSEGDILVSMAVPLATAVGDGAVRTLGIWQGSCAEMVQSLVPDGVSVVSAFQNVSAHRLRDLANEVDCDIVVSGTKAPRETVMELCSLIPGLRGINGGLLSNAKIVEEMTALMIGINIRYKLPDGVGVRFTGLPEA